jgi:hypothetical protein
MTNPIHTDAVFHGARRHNRALYLSLALLCLATLSACNLTPTNVWVYIDNASNDVLEVTVDGHLAATIAPDDYSKLVYPPGEHRFLIKAGDQVLCDLAHDLAPSDRIGVTRKYLFNPDKRTRYQTYEAKYGTNRLEGVMQASLLRFQTDPQIKRQYIYRQLLKEVQLVPAEAWNDVTPFDYVLSAPPNVVVSNGTTRRSVLSRVQPRLADSMERLTKIEKPTDEDIDTLNQLIDDMLADAL